MDRQSTSSDALPQVAPSPALLSIARRLCWWMPAEQSLAFLPVFLARLMTLGTWDDVQVVRRELGEEILRETLRHPPPGIFDAASWHYWHRVFHLEPVPPLPQRALP